MRNSVIWKFFETPRFHLIDALLSDRVETTSPDFSSPFGLCISRAIMNQQQSKNTDIHRNSKFRSEAPIMSKSERMRQVQFNEVS